MKKSNAEEASRLLGCDKIELINNHIMIYKKNKLIFKVWLKYDKWEKYKSLNEAMEDIGIEIFKLK